MHHCYTTQQNSVSAGPKTTLRYSRVAFSALVGLALLSGCDQGFLNNPTGDSDFGDEASPDELIAPDVRYQVSYDQTEQVFSYVYPSDFVATAGKAQGEEEGLLVEYERVHERTAYDADGYLHMDYVFLEGHAGMNMPEATYKQLEREMPYDPAVEDPIVRFELKNGVMRYLHRSGKVAHEAVLNPEEFRVDPAMLDSLVALQGTSEEDVDERTKAQTLSQLRRDGVAFSEEDEHHILLRSSIADDGSTGEVEQVIDLRIGQPVELTYKLRNGRVDYAERRLYERVGGVPVVTYSVGDQYGEVDGDWRVVSRTTTARENVRVFVD